MLRAERLAKAVSARATRISKLLSFALRHDPAALGLRLDAAGWVDVADVLDALRSRGEEVTREELEEIVRTSDKRRFALSAGRIRANQGHSVSVDLGLAPQAPPALLFHGTVDRFVESIRRQGLARGKRTHVHLSSTVDVAAAVAGRRRGGQVILTVRAGEWHHAGGVFFLSANGVWLTEHVPPEYITFPD
jgi:putative RNA 2'-phosphotransferase